VETGHPDVGTPRYLRDGEVLVTTIAGLGQCRNRCVAEKA
jgi:2-keto-4-pentenoate hydratase/2-oxohepta-3-ene-1,7-dioic acid hydratase in catechol pathway